MKNKVIGFLLVLSLLGTAFTFYRVGQGASLLKTLNASLSPLLEKVVSLENKVEGLSCIIAQYDVDRAERDKQIADLKREMASKEVEFQEEIARLKDAPPEHLVTEARRIEKTDEIWLRENKVEFSLVAFRNTTIHLKEWENFTLVKMPKMYELLAAFMNKDIASTKEITALKTVVTLKDEIILTEREKNRLQAEFISKQFSVKKSPWGTIKNVGLGILIGIAIYSVAH